MTTHRICHERWKIKQSGNKSTNPQQHKKELVVGKLIKTKQTTQGVVMKTHEDTKKSCVGERQTNGNVASGADKHKYACGGTFGAETMQLLIVESMEWVTFVLLAFSPWNIRTQFAKNRQHLYSKVQLTYFVNLLIIKQLLLMMTKKEKAMWRKSKGGSPKVHEGRALMIVMCVSWWW